MDFVGFPTFSCLIEIWCTMCYMLCVFLIRILFGENFTLQEEQVCPSQFRSLIKSFLECSSALQVRCFEALKILKAKYMWMSKARIRKIFYDFQVSLRENSRYQSLYSRLIIFIKDYAKFKIWEKILQSPHLWNGIL